MVLSNKWFNNEIKVKFEDTLKQIKMNSTTQNVWDTAKAILRGKFIAL